MAGQREDAERAAAAPVAREKAPQAGHPPPAAQFGAGNAAVARSLSGGSAPPAAMAAAVAGGNAAVQRLMRSDPAESGQGSGSLDPAVGAAIDRERGGGSPVDRGVRPELEQRLGADLGAVRVHTGPVAAELNRAVNARAFTSGTDIFFGAGSSPADRSLLAHEATHVVQQAGGRAGGTARVSHPGDPAEVEAAAVARGASLAEPVTADQGTLHRDPAPAVTTPSFPPAGPLPGSYPPTGDESADAEGNRIHLERSTGRWHLVAAPASLPYTPAAGYKPELLPMNPAASYRALKARCEAIAQEQLANAQKLKGDMKYYFAKVYHYVTLNELKAIEAGTYQYPHMKMQEIILFHTAYQQSLDAWQAGQKDKVEVNWRQAFAEAEEMNDGSWFRFKSQEISKALLPSMEAHIRFDLPRAIATAYDLYYAGIPGTSMRDFLTDFNNMGPVFERATADMTPEIEEDPYFFDPGDWGWMRDALFPFFFHIGLERDMAWEKAGMISRMSGRDPKSLDRAMRATMTAAHPNLEPFEVGGEELTGYDWTNQPGAPTSVPGPQPTFEPAPPAPSIPARLYFRLNLPTGDESLEQSVRPDQDLRPLLALAQWTREVREAEIVLVGHASADGQEVDNKNLGGARASLIEFFLFRAGADLDHNRVTTSSQGETGAKAGPEWRFVELSLGGRALAKRQVWGPATGVPAEAAPR